MSDGETLKHLRTKPYRREEVYSYVVAYIQVKQGSTNELIVQYGYSNLTNALRILSATPQQLRTVTHTASQYGHVSVLKKILLSTSDCCDIDDDIEIAINRKQERTVAYLLKHIDPALYEDHTETLIVWLAAYGNLRLVMLFRSIWPNVNLNDALLEAIEFKHLKVVKYLIESGADVNYSNMEGQCPFSVAVETGNFKLVKYITSLGPNLEDLDRDDVLSSAIYSCNIPLIDFLFELGFTPTDATLDDAVRTDDIKVLKFVTNHGLSLDTYYISDGMDLHPQESKDMLRYLFDHAKYDADSLSKILKHNLRHNYLTVDILELLLQHGAELPDTISVHINQDSLQMVEYVLNKKPSLASSLNENDLEHAIRFNSVAIVRHMLNTGINLNYQALKRVPVTNQEILDMLNERLRTQPPGAMPIWWDAMAKQKK
jgi:hypothetical protein